MRRRALFLPLATLAAVVLPVSASAEDKRLSLRYAATAGCPSETEFVAMVRDYTQRWSLVGEAGSPDLTVDVHMSSRPSAEIEGTLGVTTPPGAVSRREIVGPSCTEVSQALAVMVAVLLDPRAGVTGEAKSSDLPPPSAPSEAQAVSPSPSETVTRPEAPSPTRVEQKEPAPARQRSRDGASVSFDVRFETTSAVVRGALPGLGASFGLSAPSSEGPAWLRVLKPSVGIGIRQSLPKERALPQGNVELSWTAAGLRLCPLRVSLSREAELSPCAETNIGALRASASGLAGARSVSTTWVDIGGALWFSVALSKTLFFSSTVLVTMPLQRQPFVTDSGTRVASVPPLGVLGGVGLGARVWSF